MKIGNGAELRTVSQTGQKGVVVAEGYAGPEGLLQHFTGLEVGTGCVGTREPG